MFGPIAVIVALAVAGGSASGTPAPGAAPGAPATSVAAPAPVATADTLPPREPAAMRPATDVPYFWQTHAERTGYRQTGTYEQTVDYLERLATASPYLRVQSYGTSGQGRKLLLVVAARDRAFTPELARQSGRPVVLVQCGIHAGEIEGKDAMLALLRDMALGGPQQALLDRCILLVVPVFSPDAHERRGRFNRINQNGPEETGWRTTPTGLNLNRDYLKAEAVEMRAFLANVYTRWWPHLLVDTHTTDGADYRYDLTWGANHGPEVPPDVAGWVDSAFVGRVIPAVERMGHLAAPYVELHDPADLRRGLDDGEAPPRYSIGYPPLQCRPAVLIETHMLEPYETRVRATYDLVSALLAEVHDRPAELTDAVARAEATVIARGREPDPARRRVVLDTRSSAETTMVEFHGRRPAWAYSDVAGAPVVRYTDAPWDTVLPRYDHLVPSVTVSQPAGYLVPQEWRSVPELLGLHGIRTRRFARAWADTIEQARVVAWSAAAAPTEGHHPLTVDSVTPLRRWRTCRPGDVWVPLDQRAALVAVHLLEARAPDGLLCWNAFDTVLERKEYGEDYVLEPLARKMMQEDPALAREFRERLARDPAFAADPRARLDFFFRRSPWADPEQDLDPVARALRAPPEDVLAP